MQARRPLTAEERRLALIKTQRETMRTVKRALLAFALIAGIYYLYLVKTQPQDDRTDAPAAVETTQIN